MLKNALIIAAAAGVMLTLMALNAHAQQDPADLAAKLALQHYLRAQCAVANAERDAQLALVDGQPASVYLDRARALISTRDDMDRAVNDLRQIDRNTHTVRR